MNDWIVFDFDGTLSTARSGWSVLATLFGTEETSIDRKRRYFSGEITFEDRIGQDIADWRNAAVTEDDVEAAAYAIKLTTNAERVLSTLNDTDCRFGVLSAGVVDLMEKVRPFDPAFVVGNELGFEDGMLSGAELRVSATDKADRLNELGDRFDFDPAEIAYVGDSNSDIEAFEIVDEAVLFNPDPALDEEGYRAADTVIESMDLLAVLDYFSVPY